MTADSYRGYAGRVVICSTAACLPRQALSVRKSFTPRQGRGTNPQPQQKPRSLDEGEAEKKLCVNEEWSSEPDVLLCVVWVDMDKLLTRLRCLHGLCFHTAATCHTMPLRRTCRQLSRNMERPRILFVGAGATKIGANHYIHEKWLGTAGEDKHIGLIAPTCKPADPVCLVEVTDTLHLRSYPTANGRVKQRENRL